MIIKKKYLEYYEIEKRLCKLFMNNNAEKELSVLINDIIPPNITFGFNSVGKIRYGLINDDEKGASLLHNKRLLLNPIIDINEIILKLVDMKILKYWNDNIDDNYIYVKSSKLICFEANIAVPFLYAILSNQYYVNKHILKRFIKHGYKTSYEIKESRDSKLFVIAIIAILVPIVIAIIDKI